MNFLYSCAEYQTQQIWLSSSGKRRYKCTLCAFSSRSVLNPKNRARQWCLGLDSGDSGYVFDVKWFERLPWLVNLRSPPNISVMILHLKLFGRYLPKQGPALVRMPNFEFHQKQSSISELSDPQTFAAKLCRFATFSEFWKDCLVSDRNLIDISY